MPKLVKSYEEPGRDILPPNVKRCGINYKSTGVIFQITPFNFPLWISLHNMMKNITIGNTFLSRPDKSSPAFVAIIEDHLKQNGVTGMQYVYSAEADTDWILSLDQISGVSFTGSTQMGTLISSLAGKYMKKALIEAGGNDPFVVLKDADLNLAIEKAVFWRYFHAGQMCVSPKRMIIHEDVVDKFLDGVLDRVSKIPVGTDPKLPDSVLPPLSRIDILDKVDDQVQRSKSHGDEVLFGGNKVGETFYEPTVVKIKDNKSPLFREEVFGPVMTVISYKTEAEALKLANDTEYGLSGSVYGQDIEKANEFARKIDSGMIHVNCSGPIDSPSVPFGGNKTSGVGRNRYTYFANEQSFIIHDES